MSDQPRRRIPGAGIIIAVLFLVVPIGAVAWWLSRPKGEVAPPPPALSELDVVCLGRIDGLNAIANLDPGLPGKVAEVLVSDGQHVTAKTPLLKLDNESMKIREEEAVAAVAAAEIEIDAAKLEEKLQPIRKAAQEAAITAAGERITAARRVVEEKKKAMGFGTVTAAEVAVAEAEVKQLEQLESAEKSRLKELELADPKLKTRAAEAKRTTARLALKQAEKALRDCVLLAPTDGTVMRVQVSVGESVAPGMPQAPIVFRPDGRLVVRAELEQEFMGRVQEGMKATVRDDVRVDSPTWNGTVIRVGQVVARKRSVLLEPGELNDVRTVECLVALEGNLDGLLVGQRMRVRIRR